MKREGKSCNYLLTVRAMTQPRHTHPGVSGNILHSYSRYAGGTNSPQQSAGKSKMIQW